MCIHGVEAMNNAGAVICCQRSRQESAKDAATADMAVMAESILYFLVKAFINIKAESGKTAITIAIRHVSSKSIASVRNFKFQI
jgi:hypothetical protein